jgi:hypothetical protein
MIAEIKKSNSAAAKYVVKFFMADQGGFYMWDVWQYTSFVAFFGQNRNHISPALFF